MKFSDLQDGMELTVRLASCDVPDGSSPDWSVEKTVRLSVIDYGKVSLVNINDLSWAEYAESDFNEANQEFLVENYRMKIIKLKDKE